MGRKKKEVIRSHKLELTFSDAEIVKVLSLAVIHPSITAVKVGDRGSVQFDSKLITLESRAEISERVASLALQRRKIPKLTQKVLTLSSQDDNDAIETARDTLKKIKEAQVKAAQPAKK
jgi:hypothetical protein